MKTTVAQALKWLEQPFSMNVEKNRDTLIDHLNDIRVLIHDMYHRQAWVVDRCECMTVQCYCEDCHDCRTRYLGFTLPHDMESLQGISYNDRPLDLFSGWRAWSDGVDCCPCDDEVFQNLCDVVTEREPLDCCPIQWKFKANDKNDCGIKLTFRYKDDQLQFKEEEFELGDYYSETKYAVSKGLEIAISEHVGDVTVADATDRILSIYKRGELAPSYKRIRINPSCCMTNGEDYSYRHDSWRKSIKSGSQVKIIGPRKYIPVYDDDQVVEIGDPMVYKEFARFLNLNNREAAGRSIMQNAREHRAAAEDLLMGRKNRERGKSTVIIKPPHTLGRRSALYSKQRRNIASRHTGRYV